MKNIKTSGSSDKKWPGLLSLPDENKYNKSYTVMKL